MCASRLCMRTKRLLRVCASSPKLGQSMHAKAHGPQGRRDESDYSGLEDGPSVVSLSGELPTASFNLRRLKPMTAPEPEPLLPRRELQDATAEPDCGYRYYTINGVPVTVTLIGRDLQRLEQMFDDLVEEWGLDTEQKPSRRVQ